MKISNLVEQSSRKGRKLIVAEVAETVNTHQNINSQFSKIHQLVEQSHRKGRKLIADEISETVNTDHEQLLTQP